MDPQRLIFGERYDTCNVPIEILAEAAKVVDVISVQPYQGKFSEAKYDEWHKLTGKPLVISDWNLSFPTPEQPATRNLATSRPARPFSPLLPHHAVRYNSLGGRSVPAAELHGPVDQSMNAVSPSPTSKPRRRWLQFSVRTLFMVVAIIALATHAGRRWWVTRLEYLVEKHCCLLDEHRYAEAEAVANLALHLYPDDEAARAMVCISSGGRRFLIHRRRPVLPTGRRADWPSGVP